MSATSAAKSEVSMVMGERGSTRFEECTKLGQPILIVPSPLFGSVGRLYVEVFR